MFHRESFIRLAYSVIVANFITLFALAVSSEHTATVIYILKGMLAGAIIWLLGEVLFSLCESLFPKSIIPGYAVLSFLILLGTAGFGYLLGIDNIILLLIICTAAEICGIGITVFYRKKYTRMLNEKLQSSKKEL